MNKELKRVSTVVLGMFLALFLSTSVIQVVQADSLRSDDRNRRTLFESYSAERGQILVDGQPIAQSVPVDDEYKFQRVYPPETAQLYAPITGYFTLNQGNAGIEDELNDVLSGTANSQFLDQVNAIITGQDPKGASVELTIDPVAQQAAWDALGDQRGAIVAVRPKTGEIIAMVSKPSYDPNALAGHNTDEVIANYKALDESPDNPLVNRTIGGGLYHPGSTFKVLLAAAGLDSGALTPDSQAQNPASFPLPGTSTNIHNSDGGSCGPGETVSLADALRLSCNIPMAQFGATIGQDTLNRYTEAFGFGHRFEVPMPVTPSVFPDDLSVDRLMLASFGQEDDRVTPLQVALMSAAVANGGKLMEPTLIEKVIAPDLSELQTHQPSVYNTPISEETAATVTQMMVSSVANGAASNARIGGVDVAGKTGTAENGADDPYTLWFTGFAPADDPEIAIAVVVENGGGRGQSAFGNQVAAPIAKRVLEAVLNR